MDLQSRYRATLLLPVAGGQMGQGEGLMPRNALHFQCWQQARWIGAGGARNMHSGATVRKKAQIGLHASRPPRLAGVGGGREGGGVSSVFFRTAPGMARSNYWVPMKRSQRTGAARATYDKNGATSAVQGAYQANCRELA